MEIASRRNRGPAAPLLVTADPAIEAEVRRLAAAAGTGIERCDDPAALARSWGQAPVVLVGADRASELAATRPPRRADVHVLTAGTAVPELLREALVVGATSVMELPAASDGLVELLTDTDDAGAEPAVVIGVVGASGGCGASTFAAALAVEASRGRRCLLVDADPLGGGVDQIAGVQSAGVRWGDIGVTGRIGGRALRESLPATGSLAVLGFAPDAAELPAPGVVRETFSAARRGFDVVVVDLGRCEDPRIEAARSRCDHLLVMTRLTLPGLAAALRLRPRLPASQCLLLTRGPERGVDARTVADLLDLPLCLAMRDQPGLDDALVLGAGPTRHRRGPLARGARSVLAALLGTGR